MSVVVIVGAGASCFGGATAFQGFDEQITAQTPPLGPQLFARLQAEGGVAAMFDTKLAEIFNANFEQGMQCINNWQVLIGLQRQVAAYLARYQVLPGNYYQRLVQALGIDCRRVLWISLNYDFLLEQALWIEGLKVTHEIVAQDGVDVQVLKPHGSATFLPDIGNMVLKGNEAYCFGPAAMPFMVNPEVRFLCNADYSTIVDQLKAWFRDERFSELAPVIAQYAHGKHFTSNSNWVERATRVLAHRLAAATDVYMIGVRLTLDDTHIWEPLRRSEARVWIVNPSFDDYRWWSKGRTAPVLHLAPTFSETETIQSSITTQLK